MAGSLLQGEVRGSEVRQQLAFSIRALRAGANGPLRPAFQRMTARYLGFVRTRFVRASRGDGTWPQLARSTKLAKLRKIAPARLKQFVQATGKTKRRDQLAALLASRPFPILRDTSTLLNSLTEGAPNNVISFSVEGVTVGTNVPYARYHQNPTRPGRPPQRLIMVPPDAATDRAIKAELSAAVLALLQARQAEQATAFVAEGAD